MKTKQIELLLLSAGDTLEISIANLYYKLTKEGKKTFVDLGENKGNEKDWILCPKIVGKYCGETYSPNSDFSELGVIKIRTLSPFAITNGNYIPLVPAKITAITVLEKKKPDVIDQLSHVLIEEKYHIGG